MIEYQEKKIYTDEFKMKSIILKKGEEKRVKYAAKIIQDYHDYYFILAFFTTGLMSILKGFLTSNVTEYPVVSMR